MRDQPQLKAKVLQQSWIHREPGSGRNDLGPSQVLPSWPERGREDPPRSPGSSREQGLLDLPVRVSSGEGERNRSSFSHGAARKGDTPAAAGPLQMVWAVLAIHKWELESQRRAEPSPAHAGSPGEGWLSLLPRQTLALGALCPTPLLFCTPASNVWEFHVLCTLNSMWYCHFFCFLHFSHSNKCIVISHCSFNLHLHNGYS